MMIKKIFLRSELEQRTNIKRVALPADNRYTLEPLISQEWANSLLTDLDKAKDHVQKIIDACSNAIHNCDYLDKVKSELACIPVSFILKASTKIGANAISRVPITITVNEDYQFEVGTDQCPKTIFPPNTELWYKNMKNGKPVWAHYPPTIAEIANIQPIKIWETEDSLIYWLDTFIKLEDPEASIRLEALWDTEDMCYTFYFPTAFPTKDRNASIQSTPTMQQVYEFIQQYAPVRTGTILEHHNIKRYQLTRILKKLGQDNHIQQVRFGVYVPIC